MFETPREGGGPAHTVPPTAPAWSDDLPRYLRDHVRRLRAILPVISVSIMALRHQNAELDSDIANVLSEHACHALDFEIENFASILAALHCRTRRKEGPT